MDYTRLWQKPTPSPSLQGGGFATSASSLHVGEASQKGGGLRLGMMVIVLWMVALGLAGCITVGQPTSHLITVRILADGKETRLQMTFGGTVQNALEKANIQLESLDRVEPPSYTILNDQIQIKITRVREKFDVEEQIIAFARQSVHNEALPEGKTLLIQPGVNGLQKITYRRVFENDTEISRVIFKTEIAREAKPEIVMVGVQSPFMALPVTGRLVYLAAGNAWVMEENTGNRRPVVTTGDLDGRIFSLSPDGKWLLFTRKAGADTTDLINTLWAINVARVNAEPVSLRAKNIIHYADWVPGAEFTITYSTVEPRATSPGWQANNDLNRLIFDSEGKVLSIKTIVESNSGGLYGWWGTSFAWSPDGKRLAYARSDGIGMVNLSTGKLEPLLNIVPYQARGDWAWVPGLVWSTDRRILYTVNHATKAGLASNETSPLFDLVAMVLSEGFTLPLATQTGMFAYPMISPSFGNDNFMVAYLQAIIAEKSDTSRYRLAVMDRDGSDRRLLFPAEGAQGLDPQRVSWSPGATRQKALVAVVYQGNLWFIDAAIPSKDASQTIQKQQVTGDGSINRIDWK